MQTQSPSFQATKHQGTLSNKCLLLLQSVVLKLITCLFSSGLKGLHAEICSTESWKWWHLAWCLDPQLICMSHQLARDDKDKGTMHPTKLLPVQTIALQWHTAAKEVWQCKQLKWEHNTTIVVIFVLQVLKVRDVHTNCAVTHSHSGNLRPSGPQGYRCPHIPCGTICHSHHSKPEWTQKFTLKILANNGRFTQSHIHTLWTV